MGQWCNHDTPAIRDGICECGARPRAFPTQGVLAEFLVSEFGKGERTALDLAGDLSSDGYWFQIDVSKTGEHHDFRVLARVGGWYLVLPYRTDEAIRR